jgi:rhamnogalacturonan endolyase
MTQLGEGPPPRTVAASESGPDAGSARSRVGRPLATHGVGRRQGCGKRRHVGPTLAAMLLLLLLPGQLRLASAATTIARDRGGTVVMDNGVMQLELNRQGQLTHLGFQGRSLLGSQKGYWQANMSLGGSGRNQFQLLGTAPQVVRNSAEEAEVIVPQPPRDGFPLAASLHYVVRAGESGFYLFMTLEHGTSMGSGLLDQFAYNLRLDPGQFNYIAVSDDRQGISHPGRDETRSAEITDSTYLLPDGRVVSKYDYVVDMAKDEHRVFGWAGDRFGVWLIQPSGEYITGAPYAQLLSAHQTPQSPIIVWQPHSEHFGTSAIEAAGQWRKLFGPVFWYVNTGAGGRAMWSDAKRRAHEELARWPYHWMEHPFYEKHRGEIRGRLRMTDGTSAENALVFLGDPGGDWYRAWRGYVASARADAQGAFTIRNAVPGNYSLYSIAAGVLGEFRGPTVEVQRGGVTDLGTLTWTPVVHGRRLWQIGIPDRSAAEFRSGSHRRWGNWQLEYPEQFPNGVRFVVGKSREAVDWNYLHPVWAPPGRIPPVRRDLQEFYTRSPVWRIEFDLDKPLAGTAYLTFALAGMRNAGLRIGVNGTSVAQFDLPYRDSAGPRGAPRGAYWQRVVPFDARLLVTGRNVITLEHARPVRLEEDPVTRQLIRRGDIYASILYDCIRLEVSEPRS